MIVSSLYEKHNIATPFFAYKMEYDRALKKRSYVTNFQ